MYPEKKGGSHKMARPQQNWGLLTLLTRWASIWTMPNTASPKSELPCGRAVYTPVYTTVRATILGHPPQKTAPGGSVRLRLGTNNELLDEIMYGGKRPQYIYANHRVSLRGLLSWLHQVQVYLYPPCSYHNHAIVCLPLGMPEQNFNFSCHIKQSFEIEVWV